MLTQPSISVLILSSGMSSRMGFPKALLKTAGGTPFLCRLIETYHEAGIRKIRIVTNPDIKEDILEILQKSGYLAEIELIINIHPDSQRIDSIRAGLKGLKPLEHVFIQDVDRPLVSPNTIQEMIRGYLQTGFTQPIFEGRKGHPVLLSPQIVSYIHKNDQHTKTLKDVLKSFQSHLVSVDDPGIHQNINTPEEYDSFVKEYSSVRRG